MGLACAAAPAHPGGPIELIWLWVSPLARRRGVGSAGVAAVLRWAADVHPDSPGRDRAALPRDRALGLFGRHGFTRTREGCG
jgi:GNAT superfamily N-acetyltransferase